GRITLFAALLFTLVVMPGLSARADSCNLVDSRAGTCSSGASAQIANGGVAIGATKTRPGKKIGSGGVVRKPLPGAAPRPSTLLPGGAPEIPGVWIGRDGVTVNDPVTVSDLVNFKPVPGVDHMEPNGWVIVGPDTNFYATVQPQVQSGLLLGQQASVRFTAAGFHWSYGDGHSRSTATRGATWKALGIREFDPTGTSHVYDKRGEYDIDLIIDFTAEYQYAGGPGAAGSREPPACLRGRGENRACRAELPHPTQRPRLLTRPSERPIDPIGEAPRVQAARSQRPQIECSGWRWMLAALGRSSTNDRHSPGSARRAEPAQRHPEPGPQRRRERTHQRVAARRPRDDTAAQLGTADHPPAGGARLGRGSADRPAADRAASDSAPAGCLAAPDSAPAVLDRTRLRLRKCGIRQCNDPARLVAQAFSYGRPCGRARRGSPRRRRLRCGCHRACPQQRPE